MDLSGVTEMTMERMWQVSAEEIKLGGMPPETPRLVLPLRTSLSHHL